MICQTCRSRLPLHAPDCTHVVPMPFARTKCKRPASKFALAVKFARKYLDRVGEADSSGQIIPPSVIVDAARLLRWARS